MPKKGKTKEIESIIKPKKCPKCEKVIIPEVSVHYKTDNRHELIEQLSQAPFFQHIDVYYRCSCGYWGHQTYRNGKLVSEIV